jgi:HD superfamily phosphohydrolase
MQAQEGSRSISHEVLSCIIATRVLHDISDILKEHNIRVEDIVRDVCAAIEKQILPSKRTQSLPYNVAPLLRDIISSDLDADRMDYLMRDSHMCGVSYGLYDQDRILKSMCAYVTLKNRTVRAAVRYSGVGALEDLLIARYQMYAQIYGHKTNRACSAMLDAIQERLRESGWSWYQGCVFLQQLLDRFAELDDQKFISQLLDPKTNGHQGQVKEIAEKLFVERKLVKRVFEERVLHTEEDGPRQQRVERRVNQHIRRLKKAGIWARTDVFPNKGPKIKSPKYSLKVLRKHHDQGWYEVHEAKDFSTVAYYLPEIEKTYRIYAKEKNVK